MRGFKGGQRAIAREVGRLLREQARTLEELGDADLLNTRSGGNPQSPAWETLSGAGRG